MRVNSERVNDTGSTRGFRAGDNGLERIGPSFTRTDLLLQVLKPSKNNHPASAILKIALIDPSPRLIWPP